MVIALKTVGALFILMAIAIYRANRLRPANRYFSLLALSSGLWSFNYGYILQGGEYLHLHLRVGAALAAFLPAMISIVSHAIRHPGHRAFDKRPLLIFWLVAGCGLAALTLTPSFVVRTGSTTVSFGTLWIWQHMLLSAAMVSTGWVAARHLNSLNGPRRSELLVTVVFTSCAIAAISASLAWFGPSAIIVGIVAACALWIAWSMLMEKIYDARRTLHVLARTISIVVVSSGVFVLTEKLLSADFGTGSLLSKFAASIVATTCGFYIAQYFFGRSMARLNKDLTGFHNHLSRIGRSCNDPVQAAAEIEQLLTEYSANTYTWILNETSPGVFQGAGGQLDAPQLNWHLVNDTRWLTPETIPQLRPGDRVSQTREWLREARASLVVLTSRSDQHVNCAIIFGERRSAISYTYYEVERLAMMAESVAGTLATVSASAQAQRAGQLMALGMVSASVLHEIKQPVAALRLFFKMLPTHYSEQRFRDDYFHLLPGELDRIQNTLADFLKLSRLDEFRLEVFCPEAILQEVVRLVTPKARQYDITLSADFKRHHSIYADQNVLKQAALNLVLNALDALAEPGFARREVRLVTSLNSNRWSCTVSDTGPGLSAEVMANLFRPFMTTKENGTGLGLYIARDQISKVGGRVSARNRPEGGAEFQIEFPLATAEHVKPELPPIRPLQRVE